MTADDKWGHTYIYSGGNITEKPIPGEKPALRYYYRENDGWAFVRRGAERKIVIDFDPNITPEGLEKILQHINIDKDVKEILQEMVKSGEIKSGTYDE